MVLIDLIKTLGPACDVKKLATIDLAYRFNIPRYDQTLTPVCESSIEFVVRKRVKDEIIAKGLMPINQQPNKQMRIHLNQYAQDRISLKDANIDKPPFSNDSEV